MTKGEKKIILREYFKSCFISGVSSCIADVESSLVIAIDSTSNMHRSFGVGDLMIALLKNYAVYIDIRELAKHQAEEYFSEIYTTLPAFREKYGQVMMVSNPVVWDDYLNNHGGKEYLKKIIEEVITNESN